MENSLITLTLDLRPFFPNECIKDAEFDSVFAKISRQALFCLVVAIERHYICCLIKIIAKRMLPQPAILFLGTESR